MKEPLLSVDGSPQMEPGPEPDLAEAETSAAPSRGARHQPIPIHPQAGEYSNEFSPGAEDLIDPLTLAAPVRPARARKPNRPGRPLSIRIPVSALILGSCGLALLLTGVLAGMKISDYYHGRYFEKRFAGLFDLPDLAAVPNIAAEPAAQPAALAPAAPVSAPAPAPAVAVATAPQALPPGSPGAAASTGPRSENPDTQAELEALRQERQLVSQRFEQLNAGRPSVPAPGAPPAAVAAAGKLPRGQLPSSSPSFGKMLSSDSGGAPQLSAEELRVRDAPAIARVREYDADWHFVVLDGGKERNIVPGTQLAVRRGHEILGLVKVDEVEDKESVAELQGTWRMDAQARKPKRGDDVVTYPLF